MRLINTSTLQLENFLNARTYPPYAILSHTWEEEQDELSFEDMRTGAQSSLAKRKPGFKKMDMTCRLAREEYNLKYAWIDTCCIDKSNGAELSESINSMFRWYQQADVCFAFLMDWKCEEKPTFCKWYTRGWTLQELVAPGRLIFYDQQWQPRGSKISLRSAVARMTKIGEDVLTGQTQLADVPVAVRMSWAVGRTTTREEDIAYSLLGIFDINMPMLYGEGKKAFLRLQQEIIRDDYDMSIFAWKNLSEPYEDYMGILAPSPNAFADASKLVPTLSKTIVEPKLKINVSTRYVEFHVPIHFDQDTGFATLPILHYGFPCNADASQSDISKERRSHGVYLRVVGPNEFVRALPHQLADYPIQNAIRESEVFRCFNSLSAREIDAVKDRTICIRHPSDLERPRFGLTDIVPRESWIAPSRTIFATQRDHFLAQLKFVPREIETVPGFILACRFRNPQGKVLSRGFWECELMLNDESAPKRREDYFDMDYSLSCNNWVTSQVTKVIELRGKSETKQAILSFERVKEAESQYEQFYIDLTIKDKL